jgi:hypothetical protein
MLLWFGFGRWGGTGTPDSETAYPSYAATGYSDSYSSTPIVGVNNYGAIYKSWNTAVNARLNALFIAIGQRFDSHPALEGFCPFQESAFNVDGFPGAGHEDALRSSIITTLQTIKPYFPTTVVYTSMSWLRQIGQVFPTLYSLGCGNRAPDLVPWPDTYPGRSTPSSSSDADDVYLGRGDDWGNEVGTAYRDLIPYWPDIEDPIFAGKTGCFLPSELYAFGQNTLHMTHMSWVRMYDIGATPNAYWNRTDMTWAAYRDAVRWTTGILPFLRANPTTWPTRPSAIQ